MNRKILLSPHDDDVALFCAFTALIERPQVVVVFDGYVQADRGLNITAQQRARETENACKVMGLDPPMRLWLRDNDATVTTQRIADRLRDRLSSHLDDGINDVERWMVPAWEEKGHHQHNLVAQLGGQVRYLTYTTEGKSTQGKLVLPPHGEAIAIKLRAMACYLSQMTLDPRCGCWPHFLRDLNEYCL